MKYQCEVVHEDARRFCFQCEDEFFTSFDRVAFRVFLCVGIYMWMRGTPANSIFWFLLLSLLLFIVRVVVRRGAVKEESLLVIRQLGVQLTTKFYSGKEDSQFIDNSKIDAVILNEGITCGDIIFYMAFIVKNKQKMVVAFKNLRPRLNPLLEIFNTTRTIILDARN